MGNNDKNSQALPGFEFNAEAVKELESKTTLELKERLARLALEEKELDLEIKRETIQNLRREKEKRLGMSQVNSESTRLMLAQRERLQGNCSHMKGGKGPGAVLNGQGNDGSDYSVWKHVMPSGALMILCSRCGKEWMSRDPLLGTPETPGFREATRWP